LNAAAAEMPAVAPVQLARRLHDTVAQRLAGLSYALSAEQLSGEEAVVLCRVEVEAALRELRDALVSAPSAPALPGPGGDVANELRRLRRDHPQLDLPCQLDEVLQHEPAGLVSSFLLEALRNVRKHAKPTVLTVDVHHDVDVTTITVTNDGVGARRGPSCGAGRRLLEVEASLHGGLVDSCALGSDRWQQRLILPVTEQLAV
jgi:nitrate/nitrite-specific signal transduction histidine kinase